MKQVVTKEELEKASEVVSGKTYSRKLTADESGALADDIADNEEKLDNLAEEIAGYKAVWKETSKTLKATRKSPHQPAQDRPRGGDGECVHHPGSGEQDRR